MIVNGVANVCIVYTNCKCGISSLVTVDITLMQAIARCGSYDDCGDNSDEVTLLCYVSCGISGFVQEM